MSLSRVISTIVALIVALVMIILGSWYFTLGFCLIVFLGQLELFKLIQAKGIAPATKTTLFVSQILLLTAMIAPKLVDVIFPLAGALICFYLLFQAKPATIADLSSSVFGLFYGGYLPSFWIRLRVGSDDSIGTNKLFLQGFWPESWTDIRSFPVALSVTLLAFSCIWAADIGAYLMGKYFGRTRLSAISPKKTVEGAIFGIAGSVAVAELGAWYLGWPFWEVTGAVFGLLIGVVSLLGDLTESMMKRDAGVKDSGQLIPGHGGILDRTDSYVFTAPLVYYYIFLFLPLVATLAH
ncbi:phosphatidate cytidylyltransferase [Gloeocapsa sp. PCC 73106]|uniref:phosphatidate cytidylyltransferase n=1 Tax=Gloeocapsa sp. PCC 73106 TaxID=102232 RepID=UPI0002ACB9FE|nr:phosphatidate cytidylyltransferase [Gloeocapsa sp. PCC 73106]ELR99084.1 CDP-diglyceride synthetase [Gloeocapsa sp. PCC 73106]